MEASEVTRLSEHAEWPAIVHNVTYLHAAVRLRSRLGRAGWNSLSEFQNSLNTEQLMVSDNGG